MLVVGYITTGAQSALGSRGGRSQRKTRNQMPLGQTNSLEENRSGERSTVQLSVDAEHDRDPDRGHGIWVQESGEQGMIGGAPCPRSRRSRSSGRASDGAIDTSGQDTLTSVGYKTVLLLQWYLFVAAPCPVHIDRIPS